jgi:hypothetical protein
VPRKRPKLLCLATVFLCLLLARCGSSGPQQVSVTVPAGVPANLFWADWNKSSSPWCGLDGNLAPAQVHGIRIWNTTGFSGIGTAWNNIYGDPTQTSPNWATLDGWLQQRAQGSSAANGGRTPPCPGQLGTPKTMLIDYTIGSTPAWATNNSLAAPGNCAGTGTGYGCAPPNDVNADGSGTDAQYGTFVAAVVSRIISDVGLGKLTYLELWNEADSVTFWCWNAVICNDGVNAPTSAQNPSLHPNVPSLNRLVRMDMDTYHIAKCLDPTITVIFHGVHTLTVLWNSWTGNYLQTSIAYPGMTPGVNGYPSGCPTIAASTVHGNQTFDQINMHMRDDPTNQIPEGLTVNYANLQSLLTSAAEAGLPVPNSTTVNNSEFGYTIGEAATVDIQAAYVARQYILCATYGISMCSWFFWDSNVEPLDSELGGTAYDWIESILVGATDLRLTVNGTIYVVTYTNASSVDEQLMWDSAMTGSPPEIAQTLATCGTSCTTYPIPTNFAHWVDITGTVHTISGNVVPVGAKPVNVTP